MTSATDDAAAAKLLKEFRMPYVNFLTDEIGRRIDSGELRQVDPGITARCYVGLVIGCAVNAEFWNKLEGVSYEAGADGNPAGHVKLLRGWRHNPSDEWRRRYGEAYARNRDRMTMSSHLTAAHRQMLPDEQKKKLDLLIGKYVNK